MTFASVVQGVPVDHTCIESQVMEEWCELVAHVFAVVCIRVVGFYPDEFYGEVSANNGEEDDNEGSDGSPMVFIQRKV